MHPSDGNTHAIEKHLAEIEAHDAANPPIACDECGEERDVAETIDATGQAFGITYQVCKECYESTPEPDTGRPEWEDLL